MTKYDELESLKKIRDEKNEITAKLHEKMSADLQAIMDKWIASFGIEGIVAKSYSWDCTRFQIEKKVGDDTIWDFDFRTDDRWNHEDHPVEINIGTCGSFGVVDDKYLQKEKYIVAGKFCEHLKEIEDEILSLDWKTYHDAQSESSTANWNVENVENEIKNILLQNKKNEIQKKLSVGLIVDRAPTKELPPEDHWNYRNVKSIKNSKITWMTKKNISFEGDCGKRVRISDVVNNIATDNWKIVA